MADKVMGHTEVKKAEKLSTRPGKQTEMSTKPATEGKNYKAAGKLKDKVAIITGGDSGIGRATAIAFAKEGADIAIIFLNEEKDAAETKQIVEQQGTRAIAIEGDITNENFCRIVIDKVVGEFGKLDILVNNAGEQHPQENPEDITAEQFERTFKTNVFGMFYITKIALPLMKEGSSIINTASITAYKGHPELLDYSSTKGAIVSFTRSLSLMVAKRGIRVNAVAPGPIWTPLIPSTFTKDQVKQFGKETAFGRPGQPEEVAPAFVFLASGDSSYITGQTIHINGGTIVNS